MPNWQARGFGMAFVIILSMETKVISLFDTYDLKARFFSCFYLGLCYNNDSVKFTEVVET